MQCTTRAVRTNVNFPEELLLNFYSFLNFHDPFKRFLKASNIEYSRLLYREETFF